LATLMPDGVDNNMADKKQSKKELDLLTKMRERFKMALEADQENRRDGMLDFKFINEPGYQWEDRQKKERGDRPCYEFNKVRIVAKRIINEQRSQRPQAKIRPVEGGDKKTGEILEGLARNILNTSDFETTVDYAAEYQVSAGMGAWRINTDYTTDSMFEQDITIEEIQNPFCLFCDPTAKDMRKRDAQYWILTDKMPREDYEAQYGDKDVVEFESHEFDDDEEWGDSDEVRVAEYWYKEPTEKTLYQLADGKVVDAATDEAIAIQATQPELILKQRTINTHKIMMILASGDSVLEGPTEWAGSIFPFVMSFGEYFVVDGKIIWYGIGRWAKDPQRAYNLARTAISETIAQQPQSKYWVTAEQAKGHTQKWSEAHQKNFPFLLYNADPKAPGAPPRMGAADIPSALITESQISAQEIDMVTGIFAPDVGAPNSANSGRQEIARQQQGAVSTYNYQDNMAKAHKLTYEILVDLIPKIYDTERELRILGSDGAEDYVKVNTFAEGPRGERIKINDLSVGRYDTTITVGPSFSTQRQEASETYNQMLQGNPQIFPYIGDLIFKSMDLPYSEDIADRLKAMLPPEIQQQMNEGEGGQQDPAVQAAMQQAQMAMQQVEQQAQMIQEQGAQIQQEANDVDIAKSEVEKLIAKLETEQARFEAKVAKEMANVAQKDAKLTIDKLNNESAGIIEGSKQEAAQAAMAFNQALAQDVAGMMQQIQAIASQLGEVAVGAIGEMKMEKEKPRIIEVRSARVNGELVATPIYEDEPTSIN